MHAMGVRWHRRRLGTKHERNTFFLVLPSVTLKAPDNRNGEIAGINNPTAQNEREAEEEFGFHDNINSSDTQDDDLLEQISAVTQSGKPDKCSIQRPPAA
jgi:hypothetical protein